MVVHCDKKGLMLVILIWFTSAALAGIPVGDLNLLDVDFNDKIPGALLGEGGAELGEPVDLSGLIAEIIEDIPGENYLQVEYDGIATTARSLIWELLDNVEITEGLVVFSFQFTPSALDSYSLGVRESDGASRMFLALSYTTGGNMNARDIIGPITLTQNTYVAGVTQDINFIFDMDAGTSELIINGDTLFSGREHGIDDRGVGRLLTGFSSNPNFTPFTLDNMSVVTPVELPLVLDADFEDKVLGQVIGTGGAAVGEPVSISNNLTTEIIELGMNNQALLMDNTTGNALDLEWTLLNEREITSGLVVVEVDVEFDTLDQYRIIVGGSNASPVSFVFVSFAETGNIGVFDFNGFAGFVGTYQANQMYRLRLIFDLDADEYKVLLDDQLLIEGLAYDASGDGGISQVLTGFQSSAQINSTYVIDNLQVGATAVLSDDIFSNGFE